VARIEYSNTPALSEFQVMTHLPSSQAMGGISQAAAQSL